MCSFDFWGLQGTLKAKQTGVIFSVIDLLVTGTPSILKTESTGMTHRKRESKSREQNLKTQSQNKVCFSRTTSTF